MKRTIAGLLAPVLLAAATVPASAQAEWPDPDQAPAPAADMPLGSGPFPAIMEMQDSLPGQTIYRPADLSAFDEAELPVVLWGNGACFNKGNAFRVFLTEIASYGYTVIALGPIEEGLPYYAYPAVPAPPKANDRPAAPPAGPPAGEIQMPPGRTKSAQMIEAMDWLESDAAAGALEGKADPARLGVMGMSCGGAQAIEASADPRVSTSMIWNSGLFPDGTDMAGGKMLTKDDVIAMQGPVAYISGDASDIAFANAEDDVDRLIAAGHPVFRGWQRGVGHGGNYSVLNGGEFAGVAIAWLDWQLKRDQGASWMFRGEHCGLCANPRWETRAGNLE